MEFVEGHILRSAPEAEAAFDETTRRGVGDHMADTLAALHDVDPDAVGLGDLGRHEGYIERQLKRWRGQYDQMQVEGVDHGGLVERVSDELARRIPEQQRTSVVHGDYRMDNVVLADDGTVRAILDWEICTLGDPLADLGLLMVYWSDPADSMAVLGLSPTTAPGLLHQGPDPGALRLRVRSRRLRASATTWPSATGSSACILQGVYARYVAGAGAGDQGSVDGFPCRSGGSSRWRPRRWRRPREPRGIDLTEIFEVHHEPACATPILVVALEGWVDAGLGATTAIATLLGQGHTEPIVDLQRRALPGPAGAAPGGPHRQRRHDRADLAPHGACATGRTSAGRDMLFLVGPEPDFHWRAFTDAVVGLARSWRVRMVVGLGAFPAPAPHTRPVKLAATAPAESADLIEQVGIVQGELEVPAGVLAALEMAFGANGTPRRQPVGAGPPLRGGHAVPRGERGADRGAGRGGARPDPRLVGAAAGGRQLAAPGRPAHRGQRRAPGHGAQARGEHRRLRGQRHGSRRGAVGRRDRRRARALPAGRGTVPDEVAE